MRSLVYALSAVVLVVFIIGCSGNDAERAESTLQAGRYVGYSWGGEAGGTSFDEASKYIETILDIEADGTISDASMRYWVTKDGYMTTRQSGNALVNVDFQVDPEAATPGDDYAAGTSMFTVHTADMMSFYAVAVDGDGTVAAAIVDPMTRYQMEMKFGPDFDFSTPMGEVTVDNGLMVPTIRTSGSGYLKPESFDKIAGRSIFGIHDEYSHVVNDVGELADVNDTSSVRGFLEALGVTFDGDTAARMAPTYGYFGLGGWDGNYKAIAEYVTGRNAATVRMSRESTPYQRALVAAGIIAEEDVVIGRF